MADFHRGFEGVDSSTEEQLFFEFLDQVAQLPTIAQYRERMRELCPVADDSAVLDVGCGLGHESARLARLIGDGGRVEGIDSSELMISEARRRAQQSNIPVTYQIGDAHKLSAEDSSFDLCRAERVFLYLEDPAKAVLEMARATRPGGHVVVFDFDYSAFFIDSNFTSMTRQLELLLSNDPRNPAMGRELPYLMRKAGLEVETIEKATVMPTIKMARKIYSGALSKGKETGLFTAAEVDAWWDEQEAMEKAGTLYHAHPGYIIVSVKPI